MHLSFLTSHNLLFFRFSKTSKKKTFSVFLSFFLVKSPKFQSLKLNISRTAWPILMILVSFCRILNGLSDEINLFWRCISPLSANSTVFLTTAKDYVKLSCCSSVCYCSEFPRQLILKLTGDIQDWKALWASESKTVHRIRVFLLPPIW